MNNDFLSLRDITSDELDQLFFLADELKRNPKLRPLKGKTTALIFQKPSLRTRVSFEIGVQQLGGQAVVLTQEGIGINARESAADIAELLARYAQIIVARLFDHNVLLELAKRADVPVVNALTNHSHPCQVLADLYTLRQCGRLVPGVKIVFVGDGNNVVNSWLEAAALYPMDFVLACPKGYEPDAETLDYARNAGKGSVTIVNNPEEAVFDADVIYTDVWTSMGQETESEIRRKVFAPYQVNERLLNIAKDDCVVMHCLPAIRGEEITNEVLDGKHSIVFDQAENRLHAQKALLAMLADNIAAPNSYKMKEMVFV